MPAHRSPSRPAARRLACLLLALAAGSLPLLAPGPAAAADDAVLVARPARPASVSAGSLAEGSVRVTFTMPRLRSRATFAVDLRHQAGGDHYRARVQVAKSGSATLEVLRRSAGKETTLEAGRLGKLKKGQHLRLQARVSGGRQVVLGARADVLEKPRTARELRLVDASPQRIGARGAAQATVDLPRPAKKKLSVRYRDLVAQDEPVVPDTQLTRDDPPAGPRFTFGSTTPDATFGCSWDGAPYQACASPLEPAGLGAGSHRLRVRATSYLGVDDPTPAEATFTVPGAPQKPSASTTGVPAGTRLTVHEGDVVVTRAGTRLDALDIHGSVVVKAPDVTISRSIVRGGPHPARGSALIQNYGYPRLLVEDTEVTPSYPSVNIDGIKGWDFTARRVHVQGGVDSIKVHGDDVRIEDSLLENTTWYANDPYQDGGETHNDNVQVMKGRDVAIVGNTIRGATNFAVLGSANIGDTPNLVVEGNWLDGGHCTVKFQSMGSYDLRATLRDNQFGPHRAVSYCPVQAEPQVEVSDRGNVFEDTGRPVTIYRGH